MAKQITTKQIRTLFGICVMGIVVVGPGSLSVLGVEPPSRLGYPPSRMTGSPYPQPAIVDLRQRSGTISSSAPRMSSAAFARAAHNAARNVRQSYGTERFDLAVRDLVDLLLALPEHPMRNHPAMRTLGQQMTQFLGEVAFRLEQDIAQAAVQPEFLPEAQDVLAQQFGAFPAAPGAAGMAPGPAAMAGFGPAAANNNRSAELNAAQELVDLIHTVIAPEVWDVNGGPGAVVYYAPVQALVVRAPGEVHQQLGGMLNGLRNAGP